MIRFNEFHNVIISLVTFLWTISIFNKTTGVSGSRHNNNLSAVNISYILNSFQVGYDRSIDVKGSFGKSI